MGQYFVKPDGQTNREFLRCLDIISDIINMVFVEQHLSSPRSSYKAKIANVSKDVQNIKMSKSYI